LLILGNVEFYRTQDMNKKNSANNARVFIDRMGNGLIGVGEILQPFFRKARNFTLEHKGLFIKKGKGSIAATKFKIKQLEQMQGVKKTKEDVARYFKKATHKLMSELWQVKQIGLEQNSNKNEDSAVVVKKRKNQTR